MGLVSTKPVAIAAATSLAKKLLLRSKHVPSQNSIDRGSDAFL